MITMPYFGVDGPSFATGRKGHIHFWTENGTIIFSFPSISGMSPLSLVVGHIPGNPFEYLASTFKITCHVDPNQFRLVPHDEVGRRR